jgi:hypothetical protein
MCIAVTLLFSERTELTMVMIKHAAIATTVTL